MHQLPNAMAFMCVTHRRPHLQLRHRNACLVALGDLAGVGGLGLLALWRRLLHTHTQRGLQRWQTNYYIDYNDGKPTSTHTAWTTEKANQALHRLDNDHKPKPNTINTPHRKLIIWVHKVHNSKKMRDILHVTTVIYGI